MLAYGDSLEKASRVTKIPFEALKKIVIREIWLHGNIRKGKLKDMLKGIEKSRLEDARAMFAEGGSLAKISRVTKIPVKTLKKKLPVQ